MVYYSFPWYGQIDQPFELTCPMEMVSMRLMRGSAKGMLSAGPAKAAILLRRARRLSGAGPVTSWKACSGSCVAAIRLARLLWSPAPLAAQAAYRCCREQRLGRCRQGCQSLRPGLSARDVFGSTWCCLRQRQSEVRPSAFMVKEQLLLLTREASRAPLGLRSAG